MINEQNHPSTTAMNYTNSTTSIPYYTYSHAMSPYENIETPLLSLLLLLTPILMYVTRATYLHLRLPPGPIGYPIVGVLPLLRIRPHLVVQAWWRLYGDVCSMRMGQRRVVILNSVEAMKHCFVNKAELFSARPDNFFKKLAKNKGLWVKSQWFRGLLI